MIKKSQRKSLGRVRNWSKQRLAKIRMVVSSVITAVTRQVPDCGDSSAPAIVEKYGFVDGHPNPSASFTTPDSVANSITGDIDIRWRGICPDWSSINSQTLVSKYSSGLGDEQKSWWFWLNSAGRMNFGVSDTNVSVVYVTATAIASAFPELIWLRVTWSDSSNECKFYFSATGDSWLQVGTTLTLSAAGIYDGTAPIVVGSAAVPANVNMVEGNVYRVQIFNVVGGTVPVVDMYPTDYTSGSSWVSAATGETWTLSGAAVVVPAP